MRCEGSPRCFSPIDSTYGAFVGNVWWVLCFLVLLAHGRRRKLPPMAPKEAKAEAKAETQRNRLLREAHASLRQSAHSVSLKATMLGGNSSQPDSPLSGLPRSPSSTFVPVSARALTERFMSNVHHKKQQQIQSMIRQSSTSLMTTELENSELETVSMAGVASGTHGEGSMTLHVLPSGAEGGILAEKSVSIVFPSGGTGEGVMERTRSDASDAGASVGTVPAAAGGSMLRERSNSTVATFESIQALIGSKRRREHDGPCAVDDQDDELVRVQRRQELRRIKQAHSRTIAATMPSAFNEMSTTSPTSMSESSPLSADGSQTFPSMGGTTPTIPTTPLSAPPAKLSASAAASASSTLPQSLQFRFDARNALLQRSMSGVLSNFKKLEKR